MCENVPLDESLLRHTIENVTEEAHVLLQIVYNNASRVLFIDETS